MKICWIGLGNMGMPMATHLHNAGFEVLGFDLSSTPRAAAAEAGLPVAETAHEAADRADVVFTMLPKGEHVHNALFDSLALAAWASLPLLLVWVTGSGIALGRAGR